MGFFVNSVKFLVKPFLKNPSDGCFCTTLVLFIFPVQPCAFSKTMSHFPAEYFLSLIYRLGTRVSSYFKPLAREAYFQSSRAFVKEPFCKNSSRLKAVKYFCKKVSFVDVRPGSRYASVRSH